MTSKGGLKDRNPEARTLHIAADGSLRGRRPETRRTAWCMDDGGPKDTNANAKAPRCTPYVTKDKQPEGKTVHTSADEGPRNQKPEGRTMQVAVDGSPTDGKRTPKTAWCVADGGLKNEKPQSRRSKCMACYCAKKNKSEEKPVRSVCLREADDMDIDLATPANLPIELEGSEALCSYNGNDVSFSLGVLERIRLLFQAKASYQPISQEVFTSILVSCGVQEEAALHLFTKMDWQAVGKVSWDQFCTHMQLAFQQQSDRIARAKRVEMFEPPLMGPTLPHRDPPVSLFRTKQGCWLICSQDGTLTLWSEAFKLLREKSCVSESRNYRTVARKRIIAMALAPEYNKILLITGDREIQFFEMASFRPWCQLSGLGSMPTCLDYHCLGQDKALIVYGDQDGCVAVMTVKQLGRSMRFWNKAPLHENFIPSMPLGKAVEEQQIRFWRWHVHDDWLGLVRYFPDTDRIMSCSADSAASLVIQNRRVGTDVQQARKEWDVSYQQKFQGASAIMRPRSAHEILVFSVPNGVRCFDINFDKRIVVTGGMDRKIRVWNCYLPKFPIGTMEGHLTGIFYLTICSHTSRVYSVSKDKWVKVWDVVEFTCLLTLPWGTHRLEGDLRGAAYDYQTRSFVLLSETFAVLKLRSSQDKDDRFVTSHHLPVTCCCYNHVLKQVITACEGSVVRAWDVETGSLASEFGDAHGGHGVTGMVMDASCRRLITIGEDGTGRIWNHNVGLLVRELEPWGQPTPLTTVTYLDMHTDKYILTAGWSHRLNLYRDDADTIPFALPQATSLKEDRKKGHTEEVVCSDFCQPNRIATGGGDGVMVWNKDNGVRLFHLEAPRPPGIPAQADDPLQEDKGVNCLTFLKQRAKLHLPGTLVTGGPWGRVHLWEATYMGVLLVQFPPRQDALATQGLSVTAVGSDSDNKILAVGDSEGHVTVFSLDQYGVQRIDAEPPELASWEAHRKSVTDLKAVRGHPFLISCSADCSVRLWTHEGHLVGTFGQTEPWNLADESTSRHPRVPSDMWAANLAVEKMHKKGEEVEDVLDLETTDAKRHMNGGIKTGMEYFARLKAETFRRYRALDFHTIGVMTSVGNCVPHTALRTHAVPEPPSEPTLPADSLLVPPRKRQLPDAQLAVPDRSPCRGNSRRRSSNSSSNSSSSTDCAPERRVAWIS